MHLLLPLLAAASAIAAVPTADNAWHPMGSGVDGYATWGAVGSGAEVYVAGNFAHIDGVAAAGIAHWDGSAWSQLMSGLDGAGDDLVLSSGTLYAIGKFGTAGGVTASHVASWSGTAWAAMGAGLPSYPYAMGMHAGSLYAGGGNPVWVAKWDGSAWNQIITGTSGWVYGLGSYGGNLIITGSFTDLGGAGNDNMVAWDGAAAAPLGGVPDSVVGNNAPLVMGGDLYISGQFHHIGGVACEGIARWDGAAWHPLGSGIPGGAAAILPFGGRLHAFGGFTTAGGVSASRAAVWNGTSWAPLGSGLSGEVYSGCVTDRGIVVAGPFASAGGKSVTGVAIYNPDRIAYESDVYVVHDTVRTGTLVAMDGAGTALAVSAVQLPAHGTLAVDPSGSYTYTPDAGYIGPDRFSFLGSDGGGSSNTARVSIYVLASDFAAPVISRTAPVGASIASALRQIHVAGTVYDEVGVTGLDYDIAGATTASGSLAIAPNWSMTTPSLALGSSTVTITASDAAGHHSSTSFAVLVDDVAPTIAVTTPAGGSIAGQVDHVAIAGTAADNNAVTGLTYAITGATTASGSLTIASPWSMTTPALVEGTSTVTITAVDAAGNTASAAVDVVYDVTDPSIALIQPAGGTLVTAADHVDLAGTAADNSGLTAITYAITGATTASGSVAPGTSWSFTTPDLAIGTSTVTVTATDTVGRTAAVVATIERRSAATKKKDDGCGAGLGGMLLLAGAFLVRRRLR